MCESTREGETAAGNEFSDIIFDSLVRRQVIHVLYAVDYKLCIVLKPKGHFEKKKQFVHYTAGFAIVTLYLNQIKFDAVL